MEIHTDDCRGEKLNPRNLSGAPGTLNLYGDAHKKQIRIFWDRQDIIMAQVPNVTTLAFINDPFTMTPGYFFQDTMWLLIYENKQLQEASVEFSRPEIFENYTLLTKRLVHLRDENTPRYFESGVPVQYEHVVRSNYVHKVDGYKEIREDIRQ